MQFKQVTLLPDGNALLGGKILYALDPKTGKVIYSYSLGFKLLPFLPAWWSSDTGTFAVDSEVLTTAYWKNLQPLSLVHVGNVTLQLQTLTDKTAICHFSYLGDAGTQIGVATVDITGDTPELISLQAEGRILGVAVKEVVQNSPNA